MNKKNIILIVIILSIIIIVISNFYLKQRNISSEEDSLPQSFTLNFYEDSSSSGGNRDYEGSLIFMNNTLLSGKQTSDFSGYNAERHKKCIIKDEVWVDSDTGGLCEIPFSFKDNREYNRKYGIYSQFPVTKEGIKNIIASGDILPASKEKCPHFTLCYEIIKF